MKFSFLQPNPSTIKYPGVLLRFPICLFVANYLVMYGEPETFMEFIVLPDYYIALFSSLAITLLISELIYLNTKLLDYYYDWANNWYVRIALQFLLCIVVPVAFVYFLVSYYFEVRHVLIDETNYLKYDLTVVVCFIVLLNAYYLINYLLKYKLTQNRQRISNYHSNENLTLATAAVIYSYKKTSFAITFEGEKIVWPDTLSASLDSLPPRAYFLINRSEIIHIAAIESYEPSDSRTLRLYLKGTLSSGRIFIVSQRKVVAFKQWYKNSIT